MSDTRSSRSAAGFTLIEMVVTIGIIIIAAGFLAPAVAKMFQNRKLENAGTLISSVMNEARNLAVTRKQVHHVVFLRDGLRLYAEPKGKIPGGGYKIKGGFDGKVRAYDPGGSGSITYQLNFARLPYEDIPGDLAVVGSSLPADQWQVTPEDISIRFLPDGTVDFGTYEDVPSYQFNESPPDDADIVIARMGDQYSRGYIDIRPTGRTVFKIDEVAE